MAEAAIRLHQASEASGRTDEAFDWALALRADTGALVWRVKLDPGVESAFLVGPPSTPAFDAGRLFTLSSACHLRAHDAASGRGLWEIDLKSRFGTAFPAGCGSSPFVLGGRLYVQVGGREDHRLAGFDPKSGDVLWTAKGSEPTVNASPVAASLGGVRQILVNHVAAGRSGVTGFRLSDGAVLWSLTLAEGFSFDSPMALAADEVTLSTVNDTQLIRVVRQGDNWNATPGWRTTDLQAGVSPPVAHAGHLFGFGGDYLVSVDAATGKTDWKERIYPGSLIVVDGHLVVLSASAGLLRVVEATASGYREKARLEVLNRGAQAWAPPAYVSRRVFVRNDEQIAAVDVY